MLNVDVKYSVSFKYAIGQEVTFYCGGDTFKGTITEQSNYLDKKGMKTTIVGYTIQSGGQTYYHIAEKNVFPETVSPDIAMKIIIYRAKSETFLKLVEEQERLGNELDKLFNEIPDDVEIN